VRLRGATVSFIHGIVRISLILTRHHHFVLTNQITVSLFSARKIHTDQLSKGRVLLGPSVHIVSGKKASMAGGEVRYRAHEQRRGVHEGQEGLGWGCAAVITYDNWPE
jgi:hypothetical protein